MRTFRGFLLNCNFIHWKYLICVMQYWERENAKDKFLSKCVRHIHGYFHGYISFPKLCTRTIYISKTAICCLQNMKCESFVWPVSLTGSIYVSLSGDTAWTHYSTTRRKSFFTRKLIFFFSFGQHSKVYNENLSGVSFKL